MAKTASASKKKLSKTATGCCSNKVVNDDCCQKQGAMKGLMYGLAPHTFCILFIIFTILGAAGATTLIRPLLMSSSFFNWLIVFTFFFTTVSAIIYLKQHQQLSLTGIKSRWRYLSVLYGATVTINLLLFLVIFPIATNISAGNNLAAAVTGTFSNNQSQQATGNSLNSLRVEIPCSGHASLIIGEINTIQGVEKINFRFPNLFDVEYDPTQTSLQEILSLEVFETYAATVL